MRAPALLVTVCVVAGLAGDASGQGRLVKDVSFELRQGEILGFAGLMGAGRTETARALFGADETQSGTIEIKGPSPEEP